MLFPNKKAVQNGKAKFVSRFLVWVLPFILTLIPLVILETESAFNKENAKKNAIKSWTNRVFQIAQKLDESVSITFWSEAICKKIKRSVESLPSDVIRSNMGQAVSKLFNKFAPPGYSNAKIWVGYIEDLETPAKLFQSSGLTVEYRYLFANLFRELARDAKGLANELGSQTWRQRIRATFGEFIASDLFSENYRGKAFWSVYQRQVGLTIWDLIENRGKVVGAVLIFWPMKPEIYLTSLKNVIRYWSQITSGERILPAFLPFPHDRKKANFPILIHSNLLKTPGQKLVNKLAKSMKIKPAKTNFSIGTVDLATERLQTPIEHNGWLGLIYPIEPTAFYCGVLCGPAPQPNKSFIEIIAEIYRLAFIILWLLVFFLNFVQLNFFKFSVRTELLLWFFGIAATPVALIISSGERLLNDLEANLNISLQQEMTTKLLNIETGSAKVLTSYQKTCRKISQNPEIVAFLDKNENSDDQTKERNYSYFFDEIRSICASDGMNLLGVLIVSSQESHYKFFDNGVVIKSDIAKTFCDFLAGLAKEKLRMLNVEDNSSVLLENKNNSQNTTRRKRAVDAFSKLGILATNEELLQNPDTVSLFQSGSKHMARYFNLLNSQGKAKYVLFLFWDQDPIYWKYLNNALNKAETHESDIILAGFKKRPSALELVGKSKSSFVLGIIARTIRKSLVNIQLDGYLINFFPSKRMPGYVLAATADLNKIKLRVQQERNSLLFSLTLMISWITILGYLLARWIADPIVRMTNGLNRVIENDLKVRVAENRWDELGEAGRTLDQMTKWLEERRTMSKFVAPQVLEAIAGGDISVVCRPQKREAVLMVSDVRNFTTMSESNPPEEIFALINKHLSTMTRIIHKYGGTIDRFIGDAIQAVFYPGRSESMVCRAISCALEMMSAHKRLNEERKQASKFPYFIGIGIEKGEVVTGVSGDREVRLDFTVLGESFKRAADLEAASKSGTASLIICSEKVKEEAKDFFHFIPLAGDKNNNIWEVAGKSVESLLPHRPVNYSVADNKSSFVLESSSKSVDCLSRPTMELPTVLLTRQITNDRPETSPYIWRKVVGGVLLLAFWCLQFIWCRIL